VEVTTGSVPFFVADEPWFSTLFVDSQRDTPKHKVDVPALDFRAILAKCMPTVLFVDIEGAERNLFAQPLPHLPRLIMVEIHYPFLGSVDATRVVRNVIDLGYRPLEVHGWTHVFERAP
jgi:hypothetical protein